MNRPDHVTNTTTKTTTSFQVTSQKIVMFGMSDDDSSRDSGICEMDEGAATCFSFVEISNKIDERMEIDEAIIENSRQLNALKVSSSTANIRREKSTCQVQLFKKSPVSRPSEFAHPAPLAFRNKNRKRPSEEDIGWRPVKMEKSVDRHCPSDHYHLDTMIDEEDLQDENVNQSGLGKAVVENRGPLIAATFKKFAKPSLFRHHSTVGVSTKKEDEDDKGAEDTSHLVVCYSLETLVGAGSTSYRRISPEVLAELLRTHTERQFNKLFILIDCRYPFEYDGGHIKYAINFYDRDNVGNMFFDKNGQRHKKIPIFYCEFSQKRGPSMANALRSEDRVRNEAMYPHCAFEEMYVLDKGFRNFHDFATKTSQGQLCEPFSYTRMHDDRFVGELKKWNYHRRALPGQSVFRQETLTRASVSFPSVRVGRHQSEKTTPGVPRTASRRQLFGDITNSPTNFNRPEDSMRSPSPPTSTAPLKNPQWT